MIDHMEWANRAMALATDDAHLDQSEAYYGVARVHATVATAQALTRIADVLEAVMEPATEGQGGRPAYLRTGAL